MTHPITSTESNDVIADPPLVLVSDGIKSIYVNWQGPPLPDDLSGSFSCSGQVVRSVLTGRHESISAIARAEIGNPDSDYAVKFSPMAKGQARLEVARVTPAAEQAEAQAATPQPILPQSPRRQHGPRRPPLDSLLKQAAKAGKSVKGAEVYQDRTVLQFGEPAPVEPENPWPLDEFRTKETKQ